MIYKTLDPFVDILLVDGSELLISNRDGTYTYIKRAGFAAEIALREFERLKKRAVLVTPKQEPEQISFPFYQQ